MKQGKGRHGHSPLTVVTPADEELLRVLCLYSLLTIEQVTRLLYSPGSLRFVGARLRRLAEAGYLQRQRLPTTTLGGAPWLYSLARKGASYLARTSYLDPADIRHALGDEHSSLFIQHRLAVNDVLIALEVLAQQCPEINIADLRPEWRLRTTPLRTHLADGRLSQVLFDAWVDMHIDQRLRMCIALEVDRGTEGLTAFQRKIEAILAMLDGAYQEWFSAESLTVAVITTAGMGRCAHLKRWTEEVLTAKVCPQDGELFLFTVSPSEAIDPAQLFLTPIWTAAFSREPMRFFDLTT
jgi:hypothetical protein